MGYTTIIIFKQILRSNQKLDANSQRSTAICVQTQLYIHEYVWIII